MTHLPHRLRAASPVVVLAGLAAGWSLVLPLPAVAQSPQTPAAAEPTLPPTSGPLSKRSFPVVDSIAGRPQAPLEVRKPAKTALRPQRRHLARHHDRPPIDVDRPALAGVLLVEPLPRRPASPDPLVVAPSYLIESAVAAFTVPPPPLVCQHTARDPYLPSPGFYREVQLACEPDID